MEKYFSIKRRLTQFFVVFFFTLSRIFIVFLFLVISFDLLFLLCSFFIRGWNSWMKWVMNVKTAWCASVCLVYMREWSVLWHFSKRIVWKSLLMLEFYGHSSVHNKDMLSSYVSFPLNHQLCSQHMDFYRLKYKIFFTVFANHLDLIENEIAVLIVTLAILIYISLFALQHIGLFVTDAWFRFSLWWMPKSTYKNHDHVLSNHTRFT